MRIKLILTGVILLCAVQASFAARQLLTVEDAVTTRRIVTKTTRSEVALSPDGTQVAFIVKAPDIKKNLNNYQLYLRNVTQTRWRENGRILFHAESLTGVQWLRNGKELAVISTEGGLQPEDKLNLIDVRSGKVETIASPTKRIRAFSMGAEGRRIVFCAAVRRVTGSTGQELRNRYGFRIAPDERFIDASEINNWFPDSYLYFVDRGTGKEPKVTQLHPVGPSGGSVDLFTGALDYLSLSPNGRYLLFQYGADKIPDSWTGKFYGKEFQSTAFPVPLWGLLDLEANSFRLGFDAPAYAYMHPVWSGDSRAFLISGLAPEGSSWEKQDFAEGLIHVSAVSYLHLFAVDVGTLRVSEVLHRYDGRSVGNISWNGAAGPLQVPLDGGVLVQLEPTPDGWKEVSRKTVFAEPKVLLQEVAAGGNVAIGVLEDVTTPPDLVICDLKSGQTRILTDLNPQYRELALGHVERITWVNRFGVKCWGYLIKPVGYVTGQKYPLVLMNKSAEHFFVSDGSYTTAFPPQALASSGFSVLMFDYYWDFKDLPKGFPGRLAEAVNWMAMVESGIDYAVKEGIADRTRVGIIGFSRTSWKTDFMLTHSDITFAAASSADGGLYNYGEYWLWNEGKFMAEREQMLGGPPYGKTLGNWLQYSPAFNAQHVRCPLLMEYSGYGNSPFGPLIAYEFFTALHRQGKPVELFFYPLGDHPLDTPSERVASLQRNVDWFRFWLQDYEGKAPNYDPEQFVRWRELRKLQEANSKAN